MKILYTQFFTPTNEHKKLTQSQPKIMARNSCYRSHQYHSLLISYYYFHTLINVSYPKQHIWLYYYPASSCIEDVQILVIQRVEFKGQNLQQTAG